LKKNIYLKFLFVKSVLTESKYKQQRNTVNNLKKTGQKEILCKYKWKFRWIKISQWQIILENHEYVSITSCSQTSISERTFKHLQSKSGKTLFSSFKLDIEEKYLFKISAFSMDSYDNWKLHMSLLCLKRGINLYRQIIVQFPYCHVLVRF
jgi:hypothetical protein